MGISKVIWRQATKYTEDPWTALWEQAQRLWVSAEVLATDEHTLIELETELHERLTFFAEGGFLSKRASLTSGYSLRRFQASVNERHEDILELGSGACPLRYKLEDHFRCALQALGETVTGMNMPEKEWLEARSRFYLRLDHESAEDYFAALNRLLERHQVKDELRDALSPWEAAVQAELILSEVR